MPDNSAAGNFVLKYLPIGVIAAGVIATYATSQTQIRINSKDIAEHKTTTAQALSGKVSDFLYARDMTEIKEDLLILAGDVETNEELVESVERSADKIEGQIELEVERLRNQITTSEREQNAKLETILLLLQQQAEEN